MTPAIFSLLTFLAVVLVIASVWSLGSDLFLRERSRLSKRLGEEFHQQLRERAKKSSLFKDLHKLASADADEMQQDRPTRKQRLQAWIEQSGVQLDWPRLLGICALAAAVPALLGGFISRNVLVALVIGPIGGLVPLMYVHLKRSKRLEALRSQLCEAYDLMARALRSGQTMSQMMRSVADEFPQPIAGEFSYCYEQQNLGLPVEVSLRDLSRRTGLMEVNIFAVAVIVQRQVGGNLAELLEKLAQVVRERYRIRGVVRTLTAEGRMQAGVLMVLPPAIFVAMLVINPSYARILLNYPYLLVGIVISMGIGALWIRKIINFDF